MPNTDDMTTFNNQTGKYTDKWKVLLWADPQIFSIDKQRPAVQKSNVFKKTSEGYFVSYPTTQTTKYYYICYGGAIS